MREGLSNVGSGVVLSGPIWVWVLKEGRGRCDNRRHQNEGRLGQRMERNVTRFISHCDGVDGGPGRGRGDGRPMEYMTAAGAGQNGRDWAGPNWGARLCLPSVVRRQR
jgi:hypothetical protein